MAAANVNIISMLRRSPPQSKCKKDGIAKLHKNDCPSESFARSPVRRHHVSDQHEEIANRVYTWS